MEPLSSAHVAPARSTETAAIARVASSRSQRYLKVGWARKVGVTLKATSLSSGQDVESFQATHHDGHSKTGPANADAASYSMSPTAIPPPLAVTDVVPVTSAKTRFLLLAEYRLQYGSSSAYEAFKSVVSPHGAPSSSPVARGQPGVPVILGELFLTGDAWVRPVGSNSLLVSGDTSMQRKSGKLYLLSFRTPDERAEWELLLHFLLVRAVPAERFERLLLTGWISAFPTLSNKMDRMRARRMSVVAVKPPVRPQPVAAAVLPQPEPASKDDDDEGAEVLGELVSEGDDSDDEDDEGAEKAAEDNEAKALSSASNAVAGRHQLVISTLLQHSVELDSSEPLDSAPGGGVNAIIKYSIDNINTSGAVFVLKCQRSSLIVSGELRRPAATYLAVHWKRASHTVQGAPVLRETTSFAGAARFALRNFADGSSAAGGASTPRVVLVDTPSWQLYTRQASDRRSGSNAEWSERELVLCPLMSTVSMPSPVTRVNADFGREAPRESSSAVGKSLQERGFSAIMWEGSRVGAASSGVDGAPSGASFSYLLQSVLRGGRELQSHIVSLSTSGKLFLIAEDHPDVAETIAADGINSSAASKSVLAKNQFVPLEVVPVDSDDDHLFHQTHQTAAMRQRALYRAANRGLCLNFLQEGLVEPVRIVLVGASGSGKSTIAHWLRRYSVQGSTAAPEKTSRRHRPAHERSPEARRSVDEDEAGDQQATLDALNKTIYTINASGIAVPIVVMDLPSTANGALIRTQCAGADVVVCVFDHSDEHSLTWLQERLAFICSREAAASPSAHMPGNKLRPDAAPLKTRFVLCGTRCDSLRVAVDSYRMEAFRNATQPFTGPVETAWSASIPVPSLPTDASMAANGSFAASDASLTSLGYTLPFSSFGSVWRQWRLPTSTRTRRPLLRELAHAEAAGVPTDSFIMSPQLRRIAADGVTLMEAQHSIGCASSEYVPSDDDDDEDDDWQVPKFTLSHVASLLEELYFTRVGSSIGWSAVMLRNYARAVLHGTAAIVFRSDEAQAIESPRAKLEIVRRILTELQLPSDFQYDAVKEVLFRTGSSSHAIGSTVSDSSVVSGASLSSPALRHAESFWQKLQTGTATLVSPMVPASLRNAGIPAISLPASVAGAPSPAALRVMRTSISSIGAEDTAGTTLESSALLRSSSSITYATLDSTAQRSQKSSPTWRELLSSAIPEWSASWLILRWLFTGLSFGDPRCEWLMVSLRGDFGEMIVSQRRASSNGKSSPKTVVGNERRVYRLRHLGPLIDTDEGAGSDAAESSDEDDAFVGDGVVRHTIDLATITTGGVDAMMLRKKRSLALLPFCSVVPQPSRPGRLFHPLDLMFWSTGAMQIPRETPPRRIRNAVAWTHRQLLSTAAGVNAPRHVSQSMIGLLFALGDIEVSRDHAGVLLRWADGNKDKLTDASDFTRWVAQLLTRYTSVRHFRKSDEDDAPAAVVFPAGSFLTMLSVLWATRMVSHVPMLPPAAAAMLQLGTHGGDRPWALAAYAASAAVPVGTVVDAFGRQSSSPNGGKNEASEWDIVAEHSAFFGATDVSTRSAPGSPNPLSSAAPAATASTDKRNCYHCHLVFRMFFRPAIVCQECRHRFCSRCCDFIVVLDDTNRTVKRRLCTDCRRTQSTFMNDGGASSLMSSHSASALRAGGEALVGALTGKRSAGQDRGRSASSLVDDSNPLVVSSSVAVVWEDDAQSSCSLCTSAFTLLRRRHHCRSCGSLVCAECSPFAVTLKGHSAPQRVCVSCHQARASPQRQHTSNREDMSDAPAKPRGISYMSADGRVRSSSGALGGSGSDAGTSSPLTASSTLHRDHSYASLGGGTLSRTPSMLDLDDQQRQRRRQAWMALNDSDLNFHMTWQETHTAERERELIAAARAALRSDLRALQDIRSAPGGVAALEAERGPQWEYLVLQPGYFAAHDGTLEDMYDASTMAALGPDTESH